MLKKKFNKQCILLLTAKHGRLKQDFPNPDNLSVTATVAKLDLKIPSGDLSEILGHDAHRYL